MHRRASKGKGKRLASPSPSLSPADDDDDATLANSHQIKCSRLTSPVRVKQIALAKVESKSKSSSSLKGLAGFSALVNNVNLLAAQTETIHGLQSGSSSTRLRGSTSRSKAGKMV